MFTFHKYLSIEWSLSFHFQNLHFYNSILQSRVHWPLSWKALRTLASCEAVGKVIMCLNFCFSFVDGKNSTWQHRVNLSTRWCSTCLLFCAWDSFVAYQYLTVWQRGWFLFTFYIWFSNGRGTLCSFLYSLYKISLLFKENQCWIMNGWFEWSTESHKQFPFCEPVLPIGAPRTLWEQTPHLVHPISSSHP